MFYQTSPSPQVTRSATIHNKHTIYPLLHEFPNHLRSLEISKDQENLKTWYNFNLVYSVPHNLKILLILAKNGWKKEIKSF